jgi:hypothetical protein
MRWASAVVAGSWILAGAGAHAQEMTPLFDGKSLNGWTTVAGKEGNWVVENGLLITRGEGGGWLSTKDEYADFHVSLEYKLKPGGNSGLFIRSPHEGDPAYTGMEIQILDDDDARYAQLMPYQYCGSVYGVEATKRGHTKPAGQWNQMEVIAKGTHIQVLLNGATVVDTDLKNHKDAVSTHPGIERSEGYIGLQSHSEPVEFRNIKIKSLK